MRETKFRGWDNTEKKMNQIDMIDFSDGTASSREYNGWFDIEEEISLMQYTGLKDKNGVEIYERDIVEQKFYAIFGDEDIGTTELSGTEKGQVIITPSKGTCMKNPIRYVEENGEVTENNKKSRMYKNVISSRCEVIGNIYENPELLENN